MPGKRDNSICGPIEIGSVTVGQLKQYLRECINARAREGNGEAVARLAAVLDDFKWIDSLAKIVAADFPPDHRKQLAIQYKLAYPACKDKEAAAYAGIDPRRLAESPEYSRARKFAGS